MQVVEWTWVKVEGADVDGVDAIVEPSAPPPGEVGEFEVGEISPRQDWKKACTVFQN